MLREIITKNKMKRAGGKYNYRMKFRNLQINKKIPWQLKDKKDLERDKYKNSF